MTEQENYMAQALARAREAAAAVSYTHLTLPTTP